MSRSAKRWTGRPWRRAPASTLRASRPPSLYSAPLRGSPSHGCAAPCPAQQRDLACSKEGCRFRRAALAQRPVPQGPVAASACTSQVSPAAHREMIKHLPKMARRHYVSAAADGGSKWRAGASTSLAVLRRPSMAKGLARSRPTRPPAAPEARSALLGAAGREERTRRAAAEAEAAAAPSCGASARSRRARRLRPHAGALPSTYCVRAAPWLPTWPSTACVWRTAL